MAFDSHKNFAYSTVLVAPVPASSGTSLTVSAGDGSRFPSGSFNATVCPAGVGTTPANAEIVRATISGDVMTLTRAQEGSVARSIVAGDQVFAGITVKALTDIESILSLVAAKGDAIVGTGAGTYAKLAAGTNGQVIIADSTQPTGWRWATQTLTTEHHTFNGASQLSQAPSAGVLVGAPQQVTGCQLRIDASAYSQVQFAKYITTGGAAGTKIRPQYWDGAAWQYIESSGTALELAADTNDTGPVSTGWVSTNLTGAAFVETLFRLVWYATGGAPTTINCKTMQLMFK